jgi:hypothetical protein
MSKIHFDPQHKPQKLTAHRPPSDESSQSVATEERLSQRIATRTLLLETLNEICSSLDRDIGNVVSLILPCDGSATDRKGIAGSAAHCGLHTLCSEGIFAQHGKLLGFLEIYSCVARDASAEEFQRIERAKRLAEIAIKIYNETKDHDAHRNRGHKVVRDRLIQWPSLSTNLRVHSFETGKPGRTRSTQADASAGRHAPPSLHRQRRESR